MSFLNGLFLAALPLVAVPVLIHLYRGRQRDVIPWGAMQFLTQAKTKGRSIERLEELLLLTLRMGAIVALVLALAQPLIRGAWWATSDASEVVLIVDNSLSMSRTVEDLSAWDLLNENMNEVLAELGGGDRVHVLLASGGGEWLTAEGIPADSGGKSRLEAILDNVEPTLGKAELLDCMQRAIQPESEGKQRHRRIVVFTDNQANSWQLDAQGAWRQLEEARKNSAAPTAIEIVDCSLQESKFNNLAVMQIEASSKIVQPNDSIELSALVNNTGHVASQNATVQWLVDENVVATTNLKGLQSNQSARVKTSVRLEHAGHYAITCRADLQDQIALDQQSSVVVEVSDQLPVLLVHDSQPGENAKSANELLMAALGYHQDENAQPWHSVYHPESVTSDELADRTFANYRCVIFTDLGELEPDVLDRLSEFVAKGGALWVALGARTDRVAFNRTWHDEGQGPSPVAIQILRTVDDTNEPAGMIHPPSHEHPATVHLANTTQLDIDEARLYEYWQLSPTQGESSSVSVLVESGDGSPLVVENYFGRGRILVQAFPLGLEWSNLPQLKSYVVMVHDWLDYLTAGSTARYNLSPGHAIVASSPAEAAFATPELVTPDGNEHSLIVEPTNDGHARFQFSRTHQPGMYRIAFKSGNETVASLPFYVARDTGESSWQVISEEEREKLLSALGLHTGADSSVAPQQAQAIRPEEPIWEFLLLLLIVFLASELLLSNWLGRQRSGVAVSTT